MKTKRLALIAVTPLILAACGAPHSASLVAEKSVGNIGCKLSQSEMWNSLQLVAEEGGDFASPAQLRQALLDAGAKRGLSGSAFARYVDAFLANYAATVEGIQEKFAPRDVDSWKKALAEMEVGVRVTSVHAELSDKIERSLASLEQAEKAVGAACPVTETETPVTPVTETPAPAGGSYDTVWQQLKAEANPEIYGARRTLATLYQSCDVLSLPPMSDATPELQGITILAEKHPAGGLKRVYGNLATINATHYYIHGQRLAKNTCVEIRNAPPIYDFGGKPYTTASQPDTFDMFKDGGSGTSVRGIDCSAYVFESLALAGLKTDPSPTKPLKATLVGGIGSTAFKDPQNNGLKCLDKIKVSKTKSLDNGDIVAISGHVVMLEDVGEDPFGLARAKSLDDCTTSKITSSGFDFTISQSSPSKGGTGVNHFKARDYVAGSSTFKTGLTAYAVAACKAKFGGNATVSSPNLSVVRHKRTPECMAAPLKSKNEECVDSCRAI